MVEIIGDLVWPSELIIAEQKTAAPVGIDGRIFLSGGQLTFVSGGAFFEVVGLAL